MQWWLSQILRFGIGGGGLIWETVIDKGRHPEAWVVFGGIATAEDVVGYLRQQREKAADQREQVRQELEEFEKLRSEQESRKSGRGQRE